MGRLFAAAFAFACLIAPSPAVRPRSVAEGIEFQPPEAISVSVFTIPLGSVAYGTVVLDVTISAKGEVSKVQVRRDIASMTTEAIRSIKTWKFAPARFNGKAVPSRMTVAVTFNPMPIITFNNPLPPLTHPEDEAGIQSSYQPPEVTRAPFPMYPMSAVSPKTVILEVSINEAGKGESPRVLLDGPPFTATVVQAIRDWGFAPASLNGRAVESKLVLAFCFRQFVSNP